MITVYFIGVIVMAIAIIYFNFRMMPVLATKGEFWLAFGIICLTSWVGAILALGVWFWNKYVKK